jgi:hypothetical protein
MSVQLVDPSTGQERAYWFSSPTPYVLELMASLGVDFNASSAIDVDAVVAAKPIGAKALAAMTPKDRVEAGRVNKLLKEQQLRVKGMTDDEKQHERAKVSGLRANRVKETHALVAAFLTMQEPEGTDGEPVKVWSRKQAADAIPWGQYEHVSGVVNDLVADVMRPLGEAVAEDH